MGDVLDLEAPAGVDAAAWKAAISALRDACGWHVAPLISSRVRVRVEGGLVVLPSLKVESVSEVSYRGVRLDPASYEVDSSLIHLGRRFEHHCHLSSRPVLVDVTFEHGYEELPASLASAATAAASRGVAGSLVAQVGQVRFGGSGTISGAAEAMLSAPALAQYKLGPRP